MDIADNAQVLIEEAVETAIKSRKVLSIPFSGRCLACDEPLGQRRYCDSHCREDHERSILQKF